MKSNLKNKELEDILRDLKYPEEYIKDIATKINEKLFYGLNFSDLKEKISNTLEREKYEKLTQFMDTLIDTLRERANFGSSEPSFILKLFVNCISNTNIFTQLTESELNIEKKEEIIKGLTSCGLTSQIAYILLSKIGIDVKTALTNDHAFLIFNLAESKILVIDFAMRMSMILENKTSFIDREKIILKDEDNLISDKSQKVDEWIKNFKRFKIFNKGIALSSSILLNIASAYCELKEYAYAIKICEKALSINPNFAEANYSKGEIYDSIGNYSAAITEYKEAIKNDPDLSIAYMGIGNTYFKLEQFSKAINAYEEAIRIDPKSADVYNNLGDIYFKLEQFSKAINAYEEAIKIDPKSADAYNNIGIIYFEQEKYHDAISYFKQAIKIDNKFTIAYNNLGDSYFKSKEYNEAIKIYNETFKNSINFSKNEKILIVDKIGKIVEIDCNIVKSEAFEKIITSIANFTNKIKLSSISFEVKKSIIFDHLKNIGKEKLDLNKLNQAIRCFDMCLKLNKENSEILDLKISAQKLLEKSEDIPYELIDVEIN